MLRPILLSSALLFSACAAVAGGGHDHDGDAHHKIELQGITVLHPWARASEDGNTEVFLELSNGSDTKITLTGAHLHDGGQKALVTGAPIKAGGAPVVLGSVPIAAGSEFDLDPEGVYLSLTGLEGHLHKGDTFELVLELEPLGEMEIIVEVEAHDATQHSHAGHSH